MDTFMLQLLKLLKHSFGQTYEFLSIWHSSAVFQIVQCSVSILNRTNNSIKMYLFMLQNIVK